MGFAAFNEISIKYDDNGPARYIGKNEGNGHFEVASLEKNGRATLHQSPGTLLEGSWVEAGEHGMWRIELAE